MRERVFGVVRAREGGRASARGRVGFAEETSWNELETTNKILAALVSYLYDSLLLHLSAQTKITEGS